MTAVAEELSRRATVDYVKGQALEAASDAAADIKSAVKEKAAELKVAATEKAAELKFAATETAGALKDAAEEKLWVLREGAEEQARAIGEEVRVRAIRAEAAVRAHPYRTAAISAASILGAAAGTYWAVQTRRERAVQRQLLDVYQPALEQATGGAMDTKTIERALHSKELRKSLKKSGKMSRELFDAASDYFAEGNKMATKGAHRAAKIGNKKAKELNKMLASSTKTIKNWWNPPTLWDQPLFIGAIAVGGAAAIGSVAYYLIKKRSPIAALKEYYQNRKALSAGMESETASPIVDPASTYPSFPSQYNASKRSPAI